MSVPFFVNTRGRPIIACDFAWSEDRAAAVAEVAAKG
jgi:hypothetical protein